MKKLYALTLLLMVSFSGMAQVFYSENFGTPTGTTTVANYITGTAPATFQNASPILYSGTADLRATQISSGYTGASGSGNVFITNTLGKYFQIDGLNTSSYASADLELSFGLFGPATSAPIVEQSTNGGTSWTPLTFAVSTANWKLITIAGGQIPSSASLSLRFSQPDPVAAQFRIDDVKLRNGSDTCSLSLGTGTAVCDAFTAGLDTYTVSIPFSGAGNATYSIVVSSGTIGGDNPTSAATGTITVTGITEGVALNVTVTGGTCNLAQDITAPQCSAINELPFNEPFNYTPGNTLSASQLWGNLNSGDLIAVGDGNLAYTGIPQVGNSAFFVGAGAEAVVKTVPVTTGTYYASFLMSVTDISAFTAEASANATYFAALSGTSATDYKGRIFVKKSGEQFVLGASNVSTIADEAFGPTLYNVGDVILVVIGYDFDATTLKYWFNPTVATFSAATPPTLSETLSTGIASLSGFALRQDAAGTTPSITIDALRIGAATGDVLAVGNNTITGLKVYPNPVTNGKLFIETSANAEKAVVIYDVLGKVVVNTVTATNEVNVSSLKGGVYIVKITEEGNTATRKLVIK